MNQTINLICPHCHSTNVEIRGAYPVYNKPIVRDGVVINKKAPDGTEFSCRCLKCKNTFNNIHMVNPPVEENKKTEIRVSASKMASIPLKETSGEVKTVSAEEINKVDAVSEEAQKPRKTTQKKTATKRSKKTDK